ncbi:MAG TPA: hypothetical protein VNU97_13675 [Rhizomicrobium sp.]|jgi:hypothetical protein|nr:hypothetical protein [Rhizomicrobium sp.]
MNAAEPPIRVGIVLEADNRSWIIEKMAERLAAEAAQFGVAATIDSKPRGDADLNHWMSYAFANVQHTTPTTMLITHIDDPFKLGLVKGELKTGVDVGVCMSSDTVAALVRSGIPATSLCYVLPAQDFTVQPRRIVIGLTTRLYADGRKRESLLLRLARETDLSPFRFEIFGAGWEAVVPRLEAAGAEVRYEPGSADYAGDYRTIAESIPHFDYYLYLGMDEGSMGTLDALAAGVRTIVTPQGFHIDLPHGLTHSVTEYEDLKATFAEIALDREQRLAAVRNLTWQEHARCYAVVWRAVLAGRAADIPHLLGQAETQRQRSNAPAATRHGLKFYLQALAPVRIRSALSHIPILKPVRRYLKRR